MKVLAFPGSGCASTGSKAGDSYNHACLVGQGPAGAGSMPPYCGKGWELHCGALVRVGGCGGAPWGPCESSAAQWGTVEPL